MKIQIKSKGDDYENTLPYCNPLVYEDLKEAFRLEALMTHNFKNNDVHIGYIKGVMDVLERVKLLAQIDTEEG